MRREALEGPIDSTAALARFLDERASFLAQTSLYGYLQTRAGMRYPELFDDDAFVVSINVAKWQLWLDCLSDLAVYAGSRIAQLRPDETPRIGRAITAVVEQVLTRTGTPAEAGPEFPAHALRVRERMARTDWLAVG
ncbi:MAG: esterase, partial [Steroidobacteraceae bacterium]|nr:esterase [Steroidobacteraceae bacterium]